MKPSRLLSRYSSAHSHSSNHSVVPRVSYMSHAPARTSSRANAIVTGRFHAPFILRTACDLSLCGGYGPRFECDAQDTGSRACSQPLCWRYRRRRGGRVRATSSTRIRSRRSRARPTRGLVGRRRHRLVRRRLVVRRRFGGWRRYRSAGGTVQPAPTAAPEAARRDDHDDRRGESAAAAHRRRHRPAGARRRGAAGGRRRAARDAPRARAAPPVSPAQRARAAPPVTRRPRLSAWYDGRSLPLVSMNAESQRLPFFFAHS